MSIVIKNAILADIDPIRVDRGSLRVEQLGAHKDTVPLTHPFAAAAPSNHEPRPHLRPGSFWTGGHWVRARVFGSPIALAESLYREADRDRASRPTGPRNRAQ